MPESFIFIIQVGPILRMVFAGGPHQVCCIENEGRVTLYDWTKKERKNVELKMRKVTYIQYTEHSCLLAMCYEEGPSHFVVQLFIDVRSDGGRCVGELKFPNSVLQLVLRNEYMCVVLEESVHIYSVPNLHLLRNQPTFLNSGSSCCAMSLDVPKIVFACLGMQRGTVRIERLSSPPSSSVIAAHDTGVVSIGLSGNGLFVATASERGTLIRVHSTYDDCALLYEIRRSSIPILNSKNPKREIQSLFISPKGTFIASLTYGGEISAFKLSSSLVTGSPPPVATEPSSFSNIYSRYMNQLRSTSPWFSLRVPRTGGTNSSQIHAKFGTVPFTLLVTVDSNLFIYRFDGGDPNKIVLSRCDRIIASTDDPTATDETAAIIPYSSGVDEGHDTPDWVMLTQPDEIFQPNQEQQFW